MTYRGANTVTVYFDHCGRRVYMKQLAAETGIDLYTLYQRWHRGDRDERLVRPAAPRKRKVSHSISIAQSIGEPHVDTSHR